jgi:RNA polymerase sigma factor (sigma-70 family)
MKIGAKISFFNAEMRTKRLEKGWSQKELGEAAGLTQTAIGAIETLKPRRPTPALKRNLIKIADALDCQVEDIFPIDYINALEYGNLPKKSTYIKIRDIRLDQLEEGRYKEELALPAAEDLTIEKLKCDEIREALDTLPPRERMIIESYFGFSGNPGKTFEDVGRELGITRERVRQIMAQGLSRLRHPKIRRKLRQYKPGKPPEIDFWWEV